MQAFEESSESGRHIEMTSHPSRPAALPVGLSEGELDSSFAAL
jgi:hypothetical protein